MPIVASVSPANAATGVAVDQPVTVELTRADSHNLVKVETTQADFAAGTLVSAEARATNDLALLVSLAAGQWNDSYESDSIGAFPAGYTNWYGGGAYTVQSVDGVHVLQSSGGNGTKAIYRSAPPSQADWDVCVDVKFASTGDPTIMLRGSGAWGSNPTGYAFYMLPAVQKLQLYKIVSNVSTLIGECAFTIVTGTWYTMRAYASGTSLKFKAWVRANSEPAWQIEVTDGSITAAGYLGFQSWASGTFYYDHFRTYAQTPAYSLSGSRVSPAYPLSTVGKFGTGIVEFDATTPTNTTLALFIATSAAGPWTAVASGDRMALWNEGDDLAAVSIFTKAELATTDTGQTPVLSEVRLRFLPIDSALVEIDVDGVVHTVANGCLAIAGVTAKDVAGTITDPCYEDMTFLTVGSWQDYTPKTVNVLVKYNGITISTTTFTTLDGDDAGTRATLSTIQGSRGGMYGGFMATASSALDGVTGMYGGYFVTELEYWYVRGEAGFIVEPSPFSSVDGQFYIAHRVMFDMVASGIVGQPSVTDVPGSGIVQAYQRADVPASGIVLAYQRSEVAASGIVAVPLDPSDVAASGIVGIEQRADVPASGVVYEVNTGTGIELRVISVDEAELLDAMGLLRQ